MGQADGQWYNQILPHTCFAGHAEIYETFQACTNVEYIFINWCSNVNSTLQAKMSLPFISHYDVSFLPCVNRW